MAEELIPQVDYTSRDYTAIRQDMISLIDSFLPEWTSRDEADFGVTLIELFAYMGDLLNFYIDRAANEAFIVTASQRDSVLSIASLLDYTPNGTTAAKVSLTFSNLSEDEIILPAGTQVATTAILSGDADQIIFETDEEITVPASVDGVVPGSETVTATQGVTVLNELLQTSNGTPNQSYRLFDSPVIEGSIRILVDGVTYSFVTYLVDFSGNDPVFTIITNSNEITFVLFGDGIGGRIPPRNASITATYRVGAGDKGNVSSNTLIEILTNFAPGLSVSNPEPATGGALSESTDSIRFNATQSVRELNRAVTVKDYAALPIQVSGVAKANATSDAYNSITIYIAPFGDPGLDDFGDPSLIFQSLEPTVLAFLEDKKPPSTSITIQPPAYVDVNITMEITVFPQYLRSSVNSGVTSALEALLEFDNVTFEDRISLQDVLKEVAQVPGVNYTSITLLARGDGLQEGLNDIICAVNEIPRVGILDITINGGIEG
jgi:uncharacterized phage protein gp47/JayE